MQYSMSPISTRSMMKLDGPSELVSNSVDLRKIVAEKLFDRFGQRNIKTPASLPRSVNEFCE